MNTGVGCHCLLQKGNYNKVNLLTLKLGLIIYINAERIVIDYIKPLKIALLEHCKQGAGFIFFKGLYWLHKVNFSSAKQSGYI